MKRNPDLLAGTILRMERLRQGAEQKAVCYGLCVPSYLCKIEQGAVHPNPDLLSALFRRLGVDYTQDEARLRPLEEAIQALEADPLVLDALGEHVAADLIRILQSRQQKTEQ